MDFQNKEPVAVSCKKGLKSETRKKSLTIEIRDYQSYRCNSYLGAVRIHSSQQMAVSQNIYLGESVTSEFILRPKIISSDESLRRFSPKQRNCLFTDERKLKYFSKYTKQNCLDECLSDLIFEMCECVDFASIRKLT